jgi:uncharacterized protein YndB with AHSA1/START domain
MPAPRWWNSPEKGRLDWSHTMPDIRHAISIAAPPEKIYALIATGKGFQQWWAQDVTDGLPDGSVELGFFKRNTQYRLKPVRLAAPSQAEWLCETGKEWSGTHLIFKLEPGGANTLLRFTHADWAADTDYFVSCTTTWGGLLFRIKAVAEGQKPGPLFLAEGMAY